MTQFERTGKPYFLGKNSKKFQNVTCWKFYPTCKVSKPIHYVNDQSRPIKDAQADPDWTLHWQHVFGEAQVLLLFLSFSLLWCLFFLIITCIWAISSKKKVPSKMSKWLSCICTKSYLGLCSPFITLSGNVSKLFWLPSEKGSTPKEIICNILGMKSHFVTA